jgi:hypothetical protein
LTLVKNGVDTALTCSATSVTGSVIKCTDTTHTVAVAVGDITWIRRENAVSGLKGLQSGGPGEYRFCEAFYHR